MIRIHDLLQEFNPNCDTASDLYTYWKIYIRRFAELKRMLSETNVKDEVTDDMILQNVFVPVIQKIGRLAAARERCLRAIEAVKAALERHYGGDVNIILYFGNGVGAGWYTMYESTPSLLLGFENILILDWDTDESLEELIVHEFGHLAHEQLRKHPVKAMYAEGNEAILRLYEEGFAHYFESLVLGNDSFPKLEEGNNGLAKWVDENFRGICAEYASRARQDNDVKEFFGSWFRYKGYRQVGYYLGYRIVREMAKTRSLEELALMNAKDVIAEVNGILAAAAAGR